MIKRVSRKKLEVEKYDACIRNSKQANVFGYSWYLDIVSDHWDVLVLNDYEAVMPVPWRRKFFIKYVYTPLRVLELGIFSKEYVDENEFLIELFSSFKYVNLRMNNYNSFSMFYFNRKEKQQHFLKLNQGYDAIFRNYKKDRKKDLKRATKADLTEKWNDHPNNLISLFQNNVGRRFKKMKEKDYEVMKQVLEASIKNKVGEVLSVFDKNNKLVASGFFIKQNNEIVILFSATDLKNRRNGANTFLIDRAIYKYQNTVDNFGFGGSSIKSIAKFFESFGASKKHYFDLKYNNLPKFLKFFKK